MGQFSDRLQTMQLDEGRQNSRRSRYASALTRLVERYLSEIYVYKEIEIKNDRELARWGVDPLVFGLLYKGWKKVVVRENGTTVYF